MEENKTLLEHIIATTSSGIAFKSNYERILEQVAKGSKVYIVDFIKSIEKILLSPEFPPTSKFYALFLLLKGSEIDGPQLYVELSGFKNLLNQLYLDAQFDSNEQFPEKGNKFFSQKPTIEDSIIGNNYLRLVLESLRFWSEEYGSADKKDAGNIYYVMYSSLKKIKFPNSYNYVGRNSNITTDFYLKQDFDEEEKIVDQAAINIKAFMQVTSCISTGAEYKLNSKPVFDSITENSSVYCDSLLDTITEVLESKDYPPKSKFYALYLLVQVTETQNKVFLTRFAHRKSLLTKFAQVVLNDCSAKGRGERLFPELANTPDAVIGKNYITLLLEAIKFWDAAFGSSDINSPFNAFRTLDSSIWKFADFPHKYFYVGQDLDPEGDEMGKSLSVFDPVTLIPEDLLTNHEQGGNELDPYVAREHVYECVSSGEAFKHTFEVILDALQVQNQEYIDIYLRTIFEIVNSPKVDPLQKFYALYLLAKSTEYTNESLVVTLGGASKELLSKIFQDAQVDRNKHLEDRGVTLYSKDPTPLESAIGKCTLRLILEALLFWDQNFGSDEKGSSGYMFRVMFSSLTQKKMPFPEEYMYIGSDVDLIISELEESLRNLGYVQDQNTAKPGVQQGNEQGDGRFDLNLLVNSLAKLNENKIALRHLLENNTNESSKTQDAIPNLVETINKIYTTDVEPHMEGLLKNNSPHLQKYVTDIFTEGELVDGISAEYSYYSTKRTNYLKFRNAVLKLLKEHDIGNSSSRLATSNDDLANRPSQKPDDFQQEQKQVEKPKTVSKGPSAGQDSNQPSKPYDNGNKPIDLLVSKTVPQSSMSNSPNYSPPQQYTEKNNRVEENDLKASVQPVNMGKSRIPESKLKASLNEIAQSIVVSKALANDSANKQSVVKGGLQSPPMVAVTELRKKQKLEEEVSRLRKEKLELSKEASVMMRSHILNESPNKGTEESILRSTKKPSEMRKGARPDALDESSHIIVSEYERKIDNLERQLDDTTSQITKKNYEIDGLKRTRNYDPEQKKREMKRLLDENNKLTDTWRSMAHDLSKREESPEKEENRQMQAHLRELDSVNRGLSNDLESLQTQHTKLQSKARQLQRDQYAAQQGAGDEPFIQRELKAPIKVSEKVYGTAPIQSRRRGRNNASRTYNEQESNGFHNESVEEEYLEPIKKNGGDNYIPDRNDRNDRNDRRHRASQNDQSQLAFKPSNRVYSEDERESRGHRYTASGSPVREQFIGHSLRNDPDEYDIENSRYQRGSTTFGRSEKKPTKSTLGQRNPIFGELERSLSKSNLFNFKLSCLKNKSVLYESKALKIGVTTVLLPDYSSKKKLQKIVLYYANSTNEYIDSISITHEGNEGMKCVLQPEEINTAIYPGKQIKQQALCFIQHIPFECPQLSCNLTLYELEEQLQINLPCLITKFMEFKYSSYDDFDEKYHSKGKEVFQTDVISLNQNLIKSGNDFKKYFDYLIDLNPMSEYDFIQDKASLDFGGVFELDVFDLEYYLKIRVSPALKGVFQVVADKKDAEIVKAILDTLVFLFQG